MRVRKSLSYRSEPSHLFLADRPRLGGVLVEGQACAACFISRRTARVLVRSPAAAADESQQQYGTDGNQSQSMAILEARPARRPFAPPRRAKTRSTGVRRSVSLDLEDRMSILVRFTTVAGTTEQYDEIIRRLEQSGDFPTDGLEYHVAFVSGGAVRVSEIWDSQQQLEAVYPRLMPILAEVGVELAGEPEIIEVYNTIKR
jgi:hypothetical protein